MNYLKKILKEPVVQFLVVGAILFPLFNLMSGQVNNNDISTIEVTQEKIDKLSSAFYDVWLREPTQEQLDILIDQYIQDEVYYREGLALGLDKGDSVINTRIRQKLEYIIEGTVDIPIPTEEELNIFLEENRNKYSEESIISFNQIYLTDTESEKVLLQVQSGSNPEKLGDSFLLPYSFKNVYQGEVEKQFGDEFANYMFEMEIGEWNPVRSGLANHLVYVEEIQKGEKLSLDEVRSVVERDWNSEQQEKIINESYKNLLKEYSVVR